MRKPQAAPWVAAPPRFISMALDNNKREVKPVIIASLEKGSTVAAACRGAKITRDTFYRYCKEDSEFKKQVEEAQQSGITVVEDELFKNATKRHVTVAQFFYLCNRAPDKWKNIQRIEHSGKIDDGSALLAKISSEDLKRIREILENGNSNTKAD